MSKAGSEEHREKMRKIAKEKGFGLWMTGKKLSKETRLKIGEAHKDREFSESTKQKIKEARKNQKPPTQAKITSKSGRQNLARKEEIAGRPRPEHCEVCGSIGKIYFDHNHITGEFRGWICHHCNCALGYARDSIEILEVLIEYLKNND